MVRLGMKELKLDLGSMELMPSWWYKINESTQWQHSIFFALSATYALVSAVALIQLIRIEVRLPQYGWTIQKVFHFMNFIINGVRAVVFGLHMYVFVLKPKVLTLIILHLPGMLFFTTYTLLVLFWAEIYFQARSTPMEKLRPAYITLNCIVYAIQVCIWIFLWLNDNSFIECLGQVFIAGVSFVAALGFLVYGGKLFFMLRRFPIESKGRRKKLHEVEGVTSGAVVGPSTPSCVPDELKVGSIAAICFICFLIRCFMVTLSAFDPDASLVVFYHPILDLIYYLLVEILPSALVLFILRRLPPKRVSAQYHPIQ